MMVTRRGLLGRAAAIAPLAVAPLGVAFSGGMFLPPIPDLWIPPEPMPEAERAIWHAMREYGNNLPLGPCPEILFEAKFECEVVRDYAAEREQASTWPIYRATGRTAVTYQIDGPEIVRGPWRTRAEVDRAAAVTDV